MIIQWVNVTGNKSVSPKQQYNTGVVYPISLQHNNGIRVVGGRNANMIQHTREPALTGCEIGMVNNNESTSISWNSTHLIVIGY